MTNALDVNELADEVADSNFADGRLNERLRSLVSSLAEAPKKSLPKALDSAGLEGAYRFLSNHRVTPNQILSATRHPHGATNLQDDGARWGNSTTEGSGVTSPIGSRARSGASALAAAEQRLGLGDRSRRRRPVFVDTGLEA